MKRVIVSVTALCLLAMANACGKKTKDVNLGVSVDDPDLITVALSPEATPEQIASMSDEEEAVFSAIQNGKKVSHTRLSHLFLGTHASTYASRKNVETPVSEVVGFFREVLTDPVQAPDLYQLEGYFRRQTSLAGAENLAGTAISLDSMVEMKTIIESNLEEKHKSTPRYLGTAASIVDVQKDNLLQNYSGTSLLMVAMRALSQGRDFEVSNLAAIYTEGEILPGMVTQEDGLVGIEPTVLGPAAVTYGKEPSVPMWVLSATDFVVIEIFKRYLSNLRAVEDQALQNAKDRLGLNFIEPADRGGGAGLSATLTAGAVRENSIQPRALSRTDKALTPEERRLLSSGKSAGPGVPPLREVRVEELNSNGWWATSDDSEVCARMQIHEFENGITELSVFFDTPDGDVKVWRGHLVEELVGERFFVRSESVPPPAVEGYRVIESEDGRVRLVTLGEEVVAEFVRS